MNRKIRDTVMRKRIYPGPVARRIDPGAVAKALGAKQAALRCS